MRSALLAACGLSLALIGNARAANARSLVVHVDRIRNAQVGAIDFTVTLDEAGARRTLALTARRIELPDLAIGGPLDWHCPLIPQTDGSWNCSGPFILKDAGAGTLSAMGCADVRSSGMTLTITRDRTRIALDLPLTADAPTKIGIDKLPVGWLARIIAASWPGGVLRNGLLGADLVLTAKGGLSGRYRLSGFAFDSKDGNTGGTGLDLTGPIAVSGATPRLLIGIGAEVRGGEILLGPMYAKLPATPVRLDIDARQQGGGRWLIAKLDYADPGVLVFSANATLVPAAADWLPAFEATLRQVHLPIAVDRYAATWLAARGFGDLKLKGDLNGTIGADSGGLTHIAIAARNVDVDGGPDRFALDGLDGTIDWTASGDRPATTLAWRNAHLYRIALGAGKTGWRSQAGALTLTGPLAVPILGGRLDLIRLELKPRAQKGERLSAGLALTSIAMPQLASTFGWPKFGGTLGGAIPHIGYDGSVLKLDGGLMLDVFDGTVNVTGLSLERPFGVAPALGADIEFRGLDLKLLTGAFSFGEITGRLDGHIRGLHLLDWQPSAFDAELRAPNGGRLSQRAVGSLSSVGGAGAAGGLQAGVLKLFQTFGYARLGLSCRLADNVCHMGGLDSAGAGYTIVQGSGLPHITVVGFAREVDWPTLVDRLKAATAGQTPIIR